MNHHEFYAAALDIWGENWANRLAFIFNIRAKSIKRWASGKNPIPEAAIQLVQFHLNKKEEGGNEIA